MGAAVQGTSSFVILRRKPKDPKVLWVTVAADSQGFGIISKAHQSLAQNPETHPHPQKQGLKPVLTKSLS
jgi:hypothetical protein